MYLRFWKLFWIFEKLTCVYSTGSEDRKLEEKYLGSSTRKYPNRWSISIPPRHSLIAPSGITTLADRWFNLMSSFWGTAWMLQWMSANTVHMCHDVLVTELVGFLGACMKWMSSSMSRMNFCSFEKSFWLRSFVAVANITALYMYNLWVLTLFKKYCLPMPS